MVALPQLEGAVELLAGPVQDSTELHRDALDFRRINRWFGATRSVLAALDRVTAGRHQGLAVRILDVAFGLATSFRPWRNGAGAPARPSSSTS